MCLGFLNGPQPNWVFCKPKTYPPFANPTIRCFCMGPSIQKTCPISHYSQHSKHVFGFWSFYLDRKKKHFILEEEENDREIWEIIDNKTRTSKVGAISKAQKAAQSIFWKKLEIFEFFSFEHPFCCKISKDWKRTLWRQKKFRKNVAQCQKNRKGDPLVSFGFVCYLKKVKNERGTLCTKFALAGFGPSGFRSFSKKPTDQCEVCGLKKKGLCKSRAFFLKRKKHRWKFFFTNKSIIWV